MKGTQRHALLAAGLFALGAAAPAGLSAQRGRGPDQNTPRILVATFKTTGQNDPKLGVESAEEVRKRVQDETSIRQLYVLSRKDINNFLTASGYKADSALSPTDLKELAKLMRADEILDATVTSTPNGVRIEPRLLLARDVSLAQPLPPVEAEDIGDAAKQIERELSEARKQLDNNRKCENALRDQKIPEAIAAAKAAIADYAQSTFGRLCLMTAYTEADMPPDSIIRVATAVRQIDPRSKFALSNLVAAYQAKGDTANAIQASLDLWKADRSNTQLITSLINELVQMQRPDVALPIINGLIADNPGDPQFLRTKWLLLLAANQWKDAIAAGEQYVSADTSAATVDYFTRQAAAAASDSQPQLASQIAARGVQKFPTNAALDMLHATTLRRAGQLQQAVVAAEHAVEIDPAIPNGYITVVVTFTELGQLDSAMVWGQRAIAAGADKATIGNALVAAVQPAVKKAQDTKLREDWLNAYNLATSVDSLAPSPTTKFFIAVSAFQVGYDVLQKLNDTKSCTEAQLADEMWTAAQIAMPQGASLDTNTAAQILGAIGDYSKNIAQAKKVFCK